MKRTIVTVLCGAALLAVMVPTGVMAAKGGKNSAKLQIKEGVKSGALTRADAKRLKSELKAFRAEKKAAEANGKISPEERAKLKAERQRLNTEIQGQNHDGE